MTHQEILDQLPQEHKEALVGAGWNPLDALKWILAHGCDLAPTLRMTIPLLPISVQAKTALLALLDLACPPQPVPAA